MSERNYWMDRRVQIVERNGRKIDMRRMVMQVEIDTGECKAECSDSCEHIRTVEVPFKWEVCSVCDGRGKYVNPAIDCDGLTSEDFRDDPDFAEDYFGGVYDQVCHACGGTRVEPEPVAYTDEQREALEYIRELEREDAEYERLCRLERSMGC